MNESLSSLKRPLDAQDAFAVAENATAEQLERLKAAEALIDVRQQRALRPSRFAITSQALVGYVALLGLAVNAYQSYSSRQQFERQQQIDQARWAKEFERAQRADKARAFFETSLLATDPSNHDKRLVGYALLEEFVADESYNTKATLMLEESLLQELRAGGQGVLDEQHSNGVEAILVALTRTQECSALVRAAASFDRVARLRAVAGDEGSRLFGLYVRRLVGHAAEVCPTVREFQSVREPILSTLRKVPALAGMNGELSEADASERIAQVLRSDCAEEMLVSGTSGCPSIFEHYAKLCASPMSPQEASAEGRACAVIRDAPVMATAPARARPAAL